MTAADDLAAIAHDHQALTQRVLLDDDHPPIEAHRAVKIRLNELKRGGHRPSSFSTGPSGGDTVLPAHDAADTELITLERQYRDGISAATRGLARARSAQGKILARRRIKNDDDEAVLPDVWCESCLRAGECEPRGNPLRQGVDTALCTWCHDNQQQHLDNDGTLVFDWPQLELVQLHLQAKARGGYITTKMLKEAGITT